MAILDGSSSSESLRHPTPGSDHVTLAHVRITIPSAARHKRVAPRFPPRTPKPIMPVLGRPRFRMSPLNHPTGVRHSARPGDPRQLPSGVGLRRAPCDGSFVGRESRRRH